MTTSDPTRTPKLYEIALHEIQKAPYEQLGFARPVVLNHEGKWDAVLENAFEVVVTGEVNGADVLEFRLPFSDGKRLSLDNEREIQIAGDTYRIRMMTDEKGDDGSVLTSVYAEASFYDLAYSAEKLPVEFNADPPEAAMLYALKGTEWSVGSVNIKTLRTWQCQEKNALAILRMVQKLHGGDLVFDSGNKLVHLQTFSGKDSGALFSYRKNLTRIKRVVDTRSLVTRLYAAGNGQTHTCSPIMIPGIDD